MFAHDKQKLLHEYTVFFAASRGSIRVYAEGIAIQTPSGEVSVRNGYVDSLQKTGDVVLGKIAVELSYYDMFGNRETLSLSMRETDFLALRTDLNK